MRTRTRGGRSDVGQTVLEEGRRKQVHSAGFLFWFVHLSPAAEAMGLNLVETDDVTFRFPPPL